jgi:hypothetical protein
LKVMLFSFLFLDSEYVLQKRFKNITEETKNNDYIVKGRLQEKEQEIQSMREQLDQFREKLEVLKIAKTKIGMVGKNGTMLDERRRITFGYVNNDSHRGNDRTIDTF